MRQIRTDSGFRNIREGYGEFGIYDERGVLRSVGVISMQMLTMLHRNGAHNSDYVYVSFYKAYFTSDAASSINLWIQEKLRIHKRLVYKEL